MHSKTYFDGLFQFAHANLYDEGVFVVAHATSFDVPAAIDNWAYSTDFYMADEWFGISELDLQSPFFGSGTFLLLYPSLLFCFLLSNLQTHYYVQLYYRHASSSSRFSCVPGIMF